MILVNGKQIDYKIIGDEFRDGLKPMLIFLHEGLGSLQQWKNIPERFSRKLEIPAFVYSRVGYGNSDYWTDGPTDDFLHLEAFEFLPQILKLLEINEKLILFGHSDGGTISVLAASHLKNLLGIIVETPHVILESKSYEGVLGARKILSNNDLLDRMNKYQNGRARQLVDHWTGLWTSMKDKKWDMTKEMKKISCPILLIQGDNDSFGTYAQFDSISKHVISSKVEQLRLPDCGHFPHFEKEEEVFYSASKFISEIMKKKPPRKS